MVQPGKVRLQHDPSVTSSTSPVDKSDGHSDPLPTDALAINADARMPTEPDDGFGQLWRKRYRLRLDGATISSAEAISYWREHYGEFWPEGNRFYAPVAGLKEGEVALADLEMPGGTRLSTGVIVAGVDDSSFRFVTPQSHAFAAVITFSAYPESGIPVAQVEIVMRAMDPLFELGLMFGGHRREDRFWLETLAALGKSVGVQTLPQMESEILDRRRHWRKAGNIVRNAYIRTGLYMMTRPLRRLAGWVQPRSEST